MPLYNARRELTRGPTRRGIDASKIVMMVPAARRPLSLVDEVYIRAHASTRTTSKPTQGLLDRERARIRESVHDAGPVDVSF